MTMVDFWGLNPTDDLKNLDLTTIRGIYHDGAEYYAARDIFTALGGTVTWDSTTKIATFSITGADGKTLTITVDQTQGNRLDSGGFKVEFSGAVGGNISGYAFIQHINGTNYISYTELLSYFEKIWCTEEQTEEQIDEAIVASNYLVTKEQLIQFGWHNTSDSFVEALNNALVAFGITNRTSIAMFMATMAKESYWGDKTIEDWDPKKSHDYTKEDRGAGYIQVTHRELHLKFLKFVGDNYKGTKTAEYIAMNYPLEASAWYWTRGTYTRLGSLNKYIEHYGDSEAVFLFSQYITRSYLRTKDYPDFDSDLRKIVEGAEYEISDNRLKISGRSYPLPGDWNFRSNAYRKAISIFA